MYQEERMLAILDHLKKHGRISVDQICELFQVSRDTARRDLVKLEEEEAVTRTRGGAVLPQLRHEIQSYHDRLKVVSKEKQRIGKMAAGYVNAGDVVILDASTTVQSCAEFLIEKQAIVITNSIHQADILSSGSQIDIHLLGGKLEKDHRFLYGSAVVEKVATYNADIAFIGVIGISEQGLTIAHEEDGMVKRKMIQQSQYVIALADNSKFYRSEFFTFAHLEDIDLIITDQIPEEKVQEMLRRHQVKLVVAET
ncbi:DeoR/GlpR family DNA-binding transcription regulator [Guptibacillus hwajinpoensis]|uniref:DeoR/GlpR family DNA-binding transcription regulator n=1 Tax=Guptibacillus hwajinpoensis TaxID=208199 RepID=UPI001CFD1FA6|nr:DeoR/GlpR family DNA-binding transcription regulator [Pseudalkalibacillus hwajinpoensis]WLR61198.1 DeoR/GlpR family DNA-binding transcription regulator [Pseudalkalibacillus hwajinpoensis]